MKALIFFFFLAVLAVPAPGQDYRGVRIVPFSPAPGQGAGDTLNVMRILPTDIPALLSSADSVLLYLYKPYCPGLEAHFDDDAEAFRYCARHNIRIAFIAVEEIGLRYVPARYINRYALGEVRCFVIDTRVRRSLYEARINGGGGRMKDVFLFAGGRLLMKEWSYRLTAGRVAAALNRR